jgi:hypothetical protein
MLATKQPQGEAPFLPQHMAFAKRVFLWAGAVLLIALVYLATRPLSTPRTFLNQLHAVKSLRELNLAESTYAARHPEAGFACNLSDLIDPESEGLPRAGYVDRFLGSGTSSSYHFEIQCLQVGSQKATAYTATATTLKPGITGHYALCTDQSGEILYSGNGSTTECLGMHKPVDRKYR